MKKSILWIHRWLGIFSGLVVFLLGLTGCIYAFSSEIKDLIYHDRLYISPGKQPLPLLRLREVAQKAVDPTHTITRTQVFRDGNRTWQFRALKINPEGFGYNNYYTYYDLVYVNPYTAEVVKVENGKHEFFTIVLAMHLNLLLGKPIGHPVVRWSVVIFVIILISGIILWWPKNWKKKQRQNSFLIKWNAKFKRLNYDLHNVAGFYSFLILLLIAVTGLVMSFGAHIITPKTTADISEKRKSLHHYINFIDQKPAILTAYYHQQHIYDRRQFNYGTNGKLDNATPAFDQLPLGQQLAQLDYDLHTGSALGITGKLMAFLASLVAATLPVTGLLIWLGKRK